MAGARLRGEETELLVVIDNKAVTSLTAIKDHEFVFLKEIMEENYTGETTSRYDSIYKGVSGKFTVHHEDPAILDFIRQDIDRARRRTPGVQINVKTTLHYPNGVSKRVIVPAVELGEIPVTTGSRSDYVTTAFTYKASDAQTI